MDPVPRLPHRLVIEIRDAGLTLRAYVTPATVADITGPGGKSLREEIEFLLNVARFHAGPLPAEFAANHPAEVA